MPSAVPHNIDDYESLLVALQNVLGVVVPDAQRSCLVERVEPLLSDYKLDSLASLAESLQGEQAGEIRSSVLEAISERQSGWALSPTMVNVLHKYVFAQLPDKARIWVVGCGQGQLAHAVAMEIAEYENKSGETKNFQLFASDSAQSDVKQAESAAYSAQQLSGLSEKYKKSYTTVNNTADSWQVKDKIRQNKKTVLDAVKYIDDERILHVSSKWIDLPISQLRKNNKLSNWWPIYQDGTSGITPYEFDYSGKQPAYNYYLSYQVPGDPNYYKILDREGQPIERFPHCGKKPWFSKEGKEPEPSNPSHQKYFIINNKKKKNYVRTFGGWRESKDLKGFYNEKVIIQ